MKAVVVTYHAIDTAASPLCLDPSIFREQLDCIAELGWRTATVAELGDALQTRTPLERTIALTFDDGFASVADTAAPELAARGLTATVFCVAGHLGGANDWTTDRPGGYRAPLADAGALRALAGAGIEIGSHGHAHAPLIGTDPSFLHREVIDSREKLEDAVGAPVSSFAYPYGAGPSLQAAKLVRETYRTACATTLRVIRSDEDVFALPRIDAHYVRSPELLERLLSGRLKTYTRFRRLAARARRSVRKDYLPPA